MQTVLEKTQNSESLCILVFGEKNPIFPNILRILTLKTQKDKENTPFHVRNLKNYDISCINKQFCEKQFPIWYYIIQIMNVYECDGKNIFMR